MFADQAVPSHPATPSHEVPLKAKKALPLALPSAGPLRLRLSAVVRAEFLSKGDDLARKPQRHSQRFPLEVHQGLLAPVHRTSSSEDQLVLAFP